MSCELCVLLNDQRVMFVVPFRGLYYGKQADIRGQCVQHMYVTGTENFQGNICSVSVLQLC